jgi:transcriptional regulator with XRE-family HTH domain
MNGRPRRPSRDEPRRHFIREWRRHRGLTQEALAARLGISTASVSQIETGKQGYTQRSLEAIARALDSDPASLLSRDPRDEEGIWEVWASLSPEQKRQAIAILRALIAAQAS